MADTSTQTTSPPAWYTAGMQDLLTRTQRQVDQGLPIYQGERVAGFSPWQTAGMNQVAGQVPGMQDTANQAVAANNLMLNPALLNDVGLIPGVQAMRDSIQRSVGRMLTESYLPQVQTEAIAGGGLGGNRQGIAEGLAAGRGAEAVAGATGQLDFGAWQQLLGQRDNALNRVGTLLATQAMPGQTLVDLGAMEQALAQAKLQADREKFQETANAPYFGLDQLRATLGAGQVGSTTSAKAADPSWLNVLLAGGLLWNSTRKPPTGTGGN